MALHPFVHVSALELHALSRYPSNRQNDRQKHQQTTVCLRCACAPRHNKLKCHCSASIPSIPEFYIFFRWMGLRLGNGISSFFFEGWSMTGHPNFSEKIFLLLVTARPDSQFLCTCVYFCHIL